MNDSKIKDPRFWEKWRNAGAVISLSKLSVRKKEFDQQKHPEIMPGEVWITNSDDESFWEIGWGSKRRGFVALNNMGKPIGSRWPGSFPVFAQRSELEKAGVKILTK